MNRTLKFFARPNPVWGFILLMLIVLAAWLIAGLIIENPIVARVAVAAFLIFPVAFVVRGLALTWYEVEEKVRGFFEAINAESTKRDCD